MALWRSRDVEIFTTASTASSESDFDTSSQDYSFLFKNVEFKEPERNTGEQKLLGTTSGNANSETWEEDPTVSELTGETLYSPKSGGTIDLAELFFTYTADGSNKIFNYASDPANISIFIRFGDDTNYVGFIMGDCKLNTVGGMKLEADNHATAELKVTASANQTYKVKGGTYAA